MIVPRYVLSANAAASIAEIDRYTTEQFGPRQATRYLAHLRDRLEFNAENPELGRVRPDMKSGYYSYFVGSHTIYYLIWSDPIAIINILHQSMEPSRHIS